MLGKLIPTQKQVQVSLAVAATSGAIGYFIGPRFPLPIAGPVAGGVTTLLGLKSLEMVEYATAMAPAVSDSQQPSA